MGGFKQFFINRFGPVWLKENRDGGKHFREEQIKAVSALSLSEELKRAALEAPEWYVRAAAVEKLDDRETLKTLALNDFNENIRFESVMKIPILKRSFRRVPQNNFYCNEIHPLICQRIV